jgi:hypothetical protein
MAHASRSQWGPDHLHDGIQPDKGNETIYLARDVLTGRLLNAENVSSSEKEVMKRVLAPVVVLGLPVLGAISDAQESLQQAIADLWPSIPHQLCQFHVLREASRPIYEQDREPAREFGAGREKGAAVSQACEQKLKRLQEIVALCHRWDNRIAQVRRMREWVMQAEHITGWQLGRGGRSHQRPGRAALRRLASGSAGSCTDCYPSPG